MGRNMTVAGFCPLDGCKSTMGIYACPWLTLYARGYSVMPMGKDGPPVLCNICGQLRDYLNADCVKACLPLFVKRTLHFLALLRTCD